MRTKEYEMNYICKLKRTKKNKINNMRIKEKEVKNICKSKTTKNK